MLVAILIIFFALLFIGTPIAIAMGISSMPYFILTKGALGLSIAQRINTGTDSFTLCAIPFFMLAGGLMESTGITEKIVDFANSLIGHIKGGLAHTATVSGIIMAGVSGSANADVAAIGALMLPALKKGGYDEGYGVVCVATAGGLGPIIPPSIMMVIYASVTSISTSKLFIGGIIPGLILAFTYLVLNYVYARKNNIPAGRFVGWGKLWKSFKGAIGALIMPIIIVGGILTGVFTATEAGVAAVVYGLIYGVVSRRLNMKTVWNCLINAGKSAAGPMFIIVVSNVLSYVLTYLKVTNMVKSFVGEYCGTPLTFYLFVVVVCLIAGCFIDPNATLLMIVPIFLPIAQTFGIPALQFAIVTIVALLTGGITPPVGMWLFIVSSVGGTPIEKALKYISPFLLAQCVVIALMIAFPFITTWLPSFLK